MKVEFGWGGVGLGGDGGVLRHNHVKVEIVLRLSWGCNNTL